MCSCFREVLNIQDNFRGTSCNFDLHCKNQVGTFQRILLCSLKRNRSDSCCSQSSTYQCIQDNSSGKVCRCRFVRRKTFLGRTPRNSSCKQSRISIRHKKCRRTESRELNSFCSLDHKEDSLLSASGCVDSVQFYRCGTHLL